MSLTITGDLSYNTGNISNQFPSIYPKKILYLTAGTGSVKLQDAIIESILVVGGGSGGFNPSGYVNNISDASGGIGGDVIEYSNSLDVDLSFNIVIGEGGSANNNGSNSSINNNSVNLVANGGSGRGANQGYLYSYTKLYYGGSGGTSIVNKSTGTTTQIGNAPLGGGGGAGGTAAEYSHASYQSPGGSGGGLSNSFPGGIGGAKGINPSGGNQGGGAGGNGESSVGGGGGGGGGGHPSSSSSGGGTGGTGGGNGLEGNLGGAGGNHAKQNGGGGGGGNGGANTGGGGGGGGHVNPFVNYGAQNGQPGAGGSGIIIIVYSDSLPRPFPTITYDLCMNSKYWTSDVSLNYAESDTSGAVIEILNSMGNVNLQFKQNMRIGIIAVGGGGGGGGGQYTNDNTPNSIFSGGGGGGGAIYQVEFDVFQDISFNINVGNKGAQGTGRLGGGNGGDTSIYSNTLYGTIDISAGGGYGGTSQQSVTDGSGGLLTYIFSPSLGYNFVNKDFYKSEGYPISRGGEFNDSRFDGSTVIIGQDGSGATLGYNNIPGEINYLGYRQQFSGGGGAGYFDSSSNGTPSGLGGQPGKGYGGSGGQSLAPTYNSPLVAGVSAEFYGAGGGGAGSNYNTDYGPTPTPPDYVKGGAGGEGILLIYYTVPPSNLNEYYFSEYTFLVDTSIYISPYLELPTDLSSIDISGVNFLDINTDGIITMVFSPSIGSYNFEVIIKENSNTTSYEFIKLNIVNVLPSNKYYNNTYTFEYNQIVNISPNSPITNVNIIQLLGEYENEFAIDISGNINSDGTLPNQSYPIMVYITFLDGTYDQENINIIINPPPPPPILPNTGGPIRICDSRLRACKHYSKNITGSSGNVVITGQTQSQILQNLVVNQSYHRGARWVKRNAPTNGYGSRAGAPYGYGESPKNDFN